MIREKRVQYIREQIAELQLEESVNLEFVFPELIEEVLGELIFDDINSWECDYWANSEDGKYEIFGTMYRGTATITRVK